MDYFKELRQPLTYGAIIFGISLVSFERVDFYAVVAALAAFVFGTAHDLGARYLKVTNQPRKMRHIFGMIVNPLFTITLVASIFYVMSGTMTWYFWAVALFVGFIFFTLEFTALYVKERES